MNSPIEDYALIGDCETAGLVSREEFHTYPISAFIRTAATHKT